MALTVAQLLAPPTPDQSRDSLLAVLARAGFTVTAWQVGSVTRTLIELVADVVSDAAVTVALVTRSRFNEEATGDWLTLLASSFYDNWRFAAVRTLLNVQLQDDAGAGPFLLQALQVVIADAAGPTFRNNGKVLVSGEWVDQATATLPANGTINLQFEADVPGSASTGASPLTFVTPLVGVIIGADPPVLRTGNDEETDANLRTRNRTKWATLAYAAPADAYVEWALNANASITRVFVDDDNPRGAGTIDVYIAGSVDDALGDPEINDVYHYLKGEFPFKYSRRPLTSDVVVIAALPMMVTVRGTVFVDAAYDPVVILEYAEEALNAAFDALPIGGRGGKVPLATIYRAVMVIPGVVNVSIIAPTADVSIFSTRFPVFVSALTAETI